MSQRSFTVFLFVALLLPAEAKEKKNTLPTSVLAAKTVFVMVDPDASVSATNPNEHRIAQEDVEQALRGWGRYSVVMDAPLADLVIAVRRGHGKLVNPTIGGAPNDRPVTLQPGGGGIRMGGQVGRSAPMSDPGPNGPYPKAQLGATDDMFAVYQGGLKYPLDSSPLWQYRAKNALESPEVRAVAEFRKAVEEAEKRQRQQKP